MHHVGSTIPSSVKFNTDIHTPMEVVLNPTHPSGPTPKKKVCLPSLKGIEIIALQDILYIEAYSNYSKFHLLDKNLICASRPVHLYATMLEDCHFLRIHKSHVINLDHVIQYRRNGKNVVVLTGGVEVEVSRNKREWLVQQLKKYYKF